MNQAEDLEVIAPEQYVNQKYKADDFQALNNLLLYNLVIQKKVTSSSVFCDLISNYYLVVHIIDYLALQIVNVHEEPIN